MVLDAGACNWKPVKRKGPANRLVRRPKALRPGW
jgi:hypothetical protein